VATDQTLVSADEVLTRAVGARRFWEIRTARVTTPQGTRYLIPNPGSHLYFHQASNGHQ